MRSILDQMENNGRQNGSNYGLVRAWLVHDPELASESLGKIFAESSANSGANSLDLGRMSDAIESALLQSDNLVLSPWHVDDEHAFDRLGLSGFQPIGEPEQNAEPAAFRR
jgi:hypothetical protein